MGLENKLKLIPNDETKQKYLGKIESSANKLSLSLTMSLTSRSQMIKGEDRFPTGPTISAHICHAKCMRVCTHTINK